MTPDDQQLLNLLRADARTPVAELARKLNVARTTVQERIRRLERDGVIAGYTVRLSDRYQAQRITAHVLLTVNPKQAERVIRELKAMPQVGSVYALSGVFDYLALLRGETTAEIDSLLDKLGKIEGIERTQTSIVLSVKFER